MELGRLPPIDRQPDQRWILALSGGGYRGLFTAQVLADLEAELKRPLHQVFDLISGTSIGSILALGLAHNVPAQHLVDFFSRDGTRIFPPRPLLQRLLSLVRSRYSSTALDDSLSGVFGAHGFAALKTRVIVPAVRLADSGPALFRTANGAQAGATESLAAAAMASAAAPTYFPPHTIGAQQYADGGLIANSPDMVAATEAITVLGWPQGGVHLLSIGTTETPTGLAYQRYPRRWGSLRWAWKLRLLEQMMAAQAKLSRESAQLMLGSRFFAIDSIRSSDQNRVVGLDRASVQSTQTLLAMAQVAWNDVRTHRMPVIEALRHHEAGP